MPISEAARNDLYTGLADSIGQANAETLMSVLAFHTLDEVATKGDLVALKAEVAVLRAELKGDIAELRTAHDLRLAALETGLGEVKSELRALRAELTELRKASFRWGATVLVTIIGAMAAIQFIP